MAWWWARRWCAVCWKAVGPTPRRRSSRRSAQRSTNTAARSLYARRGSRLTCPCTIRSVLASRGDGMTKSSWVSTVPRVEKPWGHEEHFALVDGRFCGKVLHVNEGHALSLQYHEQKEETVAVQSGSLLV